MENKRLRLHALLETLLGSNNVYFQAPSGTRMHYPAIRYNLSDIDSSHANDSVYLQSHFYELTVIEDEPATELVDRISKLPACRFDRSYVSDNLNHTTFTIYF